MAERAPTSPPGDQPAPAQKRRRRGKAEAPPSNVPDEVYLRHIDTISLAQIALEAAVTVQREKNGALRNAYKLAKEDGCDIDAIRSASKLKKMDVGVVVTQHRTIARVLKLMQAPLGKQYDLFTDVEVVDQLEARAAGVHAGRNGEPADNNPHQPGTDEFADWRAGWGEGQAAIVAGMGKPPVDEATRRVELAYETEGVKAHGRLTLAECPYGSTNQAALAWRRGWQSVEDASTEAATPARRGRRTAEATVATEGHA